MENYNTPTLKNELANYISGYVDGEGCFCISFSKRDKLNIGWEVKPSFAVAQNYDRRQVLDLTKEYFGCGFLRRDYGDKTLKYEVRSLDELISKIIPHFYAFPLKSSKQNDFLKFAEICKQMKKLKHLEMSGFKKIVELAYEMNGSGKRKHPSHMILENLKMKI
ncbi:MAG: LAGLIDADG family homing endonuclease [Patescibacteria group bacterium]